jgi:hypothetical protein
MDSSRSIIQTTPDWAEVEKAMSAAATQHEFGTLTHEQMDELMVLAQGRYQELLPAFEALNLSVFADAHLWVWVYSKVLDQPVILCADNLPMDYIDTHLRTKGAVYLVCEIRRLRGLSPEQFIAAHLAKMVFEGGLIDA